ncbi:immunoglobulin lambda-1 light chain-like isoform X2 [Mixophyes fleayi]|uniref:immunoglobulin lambda-1 light chain-like isoform X2 n=1 Tax=Mixophyes fleayi TaxID=3061075 RepID=UPI003F4DC4E6
MKYILVLCLLYMTGHKITVYVSGSTVGLSLEQSLPSITTAGKNPTLRCIMRGSNISSHVLSWYHQKPSNDIQFLVSHRDKSRPTYAEGIVERFIPGIEESLNAFTLTIGNVEKRDEGLYYCAVWFSNRYIFGEGTEIKVHELQYIRRPTVTLFEPSPLEIQFRHTATLLCHVERYFPKSLRIKWFLSKETPVDSLNFPAIQNADNTFCQTSALTISAKLWKKGVKITCFLEHESGMQSISTQSTEQHSGLTQKECEPKNLTAEELELSKNETGEMTSKISPGDYFKWFQHLAQHGKCSPLSWTKVHSL